MFAGGRYVSHTQAPRDSYNNIISVGVNEISGLASGGGDEIRGRKPG